MYVYTLEDFGSSGFTEITSITIHRTFFQASRDSRTLKIVDHSVTKISFRSMSSKARTLDETNFRDDDQSLRACLQGETVALVRLLYIMLLFPH